MNDSLTKFRLVYMEALAKSWKDSSFLAAMLESKNLLEFFDEQFDSGLKEMWPFVEMTVTDEKKAIWSPGFQGDWIGNDDLFTITIPTKPEEENLAEALAVYGNMFPTFLGAQTKGSTISSGVMDEHFLKFGALILQVIGLLWRGDRQDFASELFEVGDQGEMVLSKYFSYKNPWGFRLKFEKAPEGKFTYDADTKTWNDIVKNKVTMYYPECPEDVKDHAYALATHNINYDVYPFTCC